MEFETDMNIDTSIKMRLQLKILIISNKDYIGDITRLYGEGHKAQSFLRLLVEFLIGLT